ncbi:MAG: response regulator, partial [Anaerolineae bacterium]|nr:response regulator [Anaerolineae bacterium]
MVGKILVADDEKGIRMMLADMLTIDGYQVVEAANGQEAITQFETLQPDLVILDGMMPILSGFEACKQIKELPSGSRTPVLMLTALEDSGAVEQAFDAGATDYITKPIRWPLLRQRVKRLVESHQTEEALQQTRQILQNVISSVPVFFHAVDQKGIFTLTQGRVPVISETEIQIGMSFFDLYHDHNTLIQDMQRALAGESFKTAYENDGHTIQVWYAPLFDSAGGKIGAAVGGTIDHERKEVENTLAQERNLMRILIDNLPDYVFVKDTEGRFIVTNVANTRYLGRQRPQEVISHTDFD